jgi:hypothetical protein
MSPDPREPVLASVMGQPKSIATSGVCDRARMRKPFGNKYLL